ncbi:hypothetical protein [Nitrincola sp.]|uniref:hypothetical protein n=1 Tax=Nitrincola sp. TaxID=1926584 RepID=UPI003A8E7C95
MNNHLQALLTCTQERWQPIIGDPHIMGWITVAGYGIAAITALTTLVKFHAQRPSRAEAIFWYLLVIGLFFLMLNKQLDLQSLLTAVARCEAQLSGWYGNRRPVQVAFIFGLIVIGLALLALLAYLLRHALSRLWLVLLGITLLVTFVLVRAVGFHSVDILIGTQLAGWRLNWIFELGGITLVVMGCIFYNRKIQTHRPGTGLLQKRPHL